MKEVCICFCLLLLLLGTTTLPVQAGAIQGQVVNVPAPDGVVSAELYEAQGRKRRPAVIILHGRQGAEAFHAHYQRYAVSLAEAGIDAYLLSYYIGDDSKLANNPAAEQRQAYFSSRIRGWADMISAVSGHILAGKKSSGQIGLLGFSQGGFVGTAVAAQDQRITALGVFYGGIPSAFKGEIAHLPPLLELHGDADRVVPMADGKALVDLAKNLGQPAEMVVYPGAGHGFSGNDDADAQRQVIAFFRQHLHVTAKR